jgi:hypothetical protein
MRPRHFPQIIRLPPFSMDARVKPGNDEPGMGARIMPAHDA